MPGEGFTEVTTQSWFSRIGNAFKGIIFGLILFIVSFFLLFWNEGRAVKQAKTLQEGKSLVRLISAYVINPAHNQELVHLSGKADTDETLIDQEFGVQERALRLKRAAEMYQWKEEKESHSQKNMGGSQTTTTTYNYSTVWSEKLINSANFKKSDGHVNPNSMLYSSRDYIANEIKVGEFLLSNGLKRQINDFIALDIESNMPLPETLQGKAKISDGHFYFANDPQNPQVGDLRVGFMVVRPGGDVTIVAQQLDNTFGPYLTRSGGNIEMLRSGAYSADEMFHMAETENKTITWLIRVAGFFLMFIGLFMLLNPLSVLADVIPLLGNIVGVGTGMIAFLLSIILSFLTIALAWLVYRPLLGILLIFVAGGITLLLKEKIKK